METYQPVFELTDLAFPIRLYQFAVDNFMVQYGTQIDANLSYPQACNSLGKAILHALACDSKIDNDTGPL